MTAHDQLETTLASWLRDDAQRAIPDGSLAEALAPAIGRRPRPARLATLGSHWIADTWPARTWPARGVPVPGKVVGIGVAAAVVVVATAVGFHALAGPGVGGPGGGSPSPTASPSPLATPLLPSTFGSLVPATPVRIGLLAPGRYEYDFVDGQGFSLQFTVPAGWTWNGRYLSKDGIGPPGGAAIYFFGGPLQVYADPCHWTAVPSTRLSGRAADIVAALRAQPSRNAGGPIDRPFGSWPGAAIALSVPDDMALATCDAGQYRSWGPEANARSHQGPGQRDIVWAIDIPGAGVTDAQGSLIAPFPPGGLVVDATSFPGTPADGMSEIEAILGSIYMGHFG
jgi:hypothetical protein